jgi:hypothetical protein
VAQQRTKATVAATTITRAANICTKVQGSRVVNEHVYKNARATAVPTALHCDKFKWLPPGWPTHDHEPRFESRCHLRVYLS